MGTLLSVADMLLSGLLHAPGLRLQHIALVQHRYGRSTDCTLLDFLLLIRDQVPDQSQLETFFADRCWPGPPDLASTVNLAKTLEDKHKLLCTFLTVSNSGAATLNGLRVRTRMPSCSALARGACRSTCRSCSPCTCPHRPPCMLSSEAHSSLLMPSRVPGGGHIILLPGLRLRLFRNLDKDRGFVNGALVLVSH